MDRLLQIAITTAGASILAEAVRGWLRRYRAKRAARTEIPAYRDLRGYYVPDLWHIRLKRILIVFAVLFFAIGLPLGYYQLTTPGLFEQPQS